MKKLLVGLTLFFSAVTFAGDGELRLVRGDYHTPEANTHIVHQRAGLYVRGYKVNGYRFDDVAPMIRTEKVGLNKYKMRDITNTGRAPLVITGEYYDLCTEAMKSIDCVYFYIAKSFVQIGDEIEIFQTFILTSPETMDVGSVMEIYRGGKLIKSIELDDDRTGTGYLIDR